MILKDIYYVIHNLTKEYLVCKILTNLNENNQINLNFNLSRKRILNKLKEIDVILYIKATAKPTRYYVYKNSMSNENILLVIQIFTKWFRIKNKILINYYNIFIL